jgi:2-polyprenyl-3-methyl-5-hydroxy-6-metoxy-1,4-benzoquinol methylase
VGTYENSDSLNYTGERYLPDIDVPETSYEHWHRYQYASLFVEKKEVLDIACGEGYGSYLLAKTAKRVVGIDIDESVINRAASKYMLRNLDFKQGSLDAIPIEGGVNFDVVVSFETIEHVPGEQQETFLKEVKRILKPSGILLISTPSKLAYSDIPSYKNEFHVKEFYVDEFRDFLKEYFANVMLVGQRISPISYLWDLEKKTKRFAEFQISASATGFRPSSDEIVPVYVLAICSDAEIDEPPISVQIDLSDRMVSKRDEQIQALQSGIQHRENLLAGIRQKLLEREEKFGEQATQIQSLSQQISDSEDRMRHLRRKLAQREEEGLALNRELSSLETRVRGLKERLAEGGIRVRGLVETIDERERLIASLRSRAGDLERQVHLLRADLHNIKTSRAWQTALILRRIRAFVLPHGSWRTRFARRIVSLLSRSSKGVRLIRSSGFFQPEWYLAQNPDVASAGVDPAVHYLKHGGLEGRDPGPGFSSSWYLTTHPEVVASGENPLLHYLQHTQTGEKRLRPLKNGDMHAGPMGRGPFAALTQIAEPAAGPAPSELAHETRQVTRPQHIWKPDPEQTYGRLAVYVSSTGNYFFNEIRDLVVLGIQELGLEVEARTDTDGLASEVDWHLVIAPHEFFQLGDGARWLPEELPPNLILLNTEQASTKWFRLAQQYFQRAYAVWDIDYESSRRILDQRFRCGYLPLGYVAGLFREVKVLPSHRGTIALDRAIKEGSYVGGPYLERPIDILFAGNLTPRRDRFFAHAAPIFSKYMTYFHFSDASEPLVTGLTTYMDTETMIGLAQRSKIMINVHHGEDKYFEWQRIVMHGIWQGALVISEPCGEAPPFQPGIDFLVGSLDEIPDLAEHHLSTDEGRAKAQAIVNQARETLEVRCRFAPTAESLLRELYDTTPAFFRSKRHASPLQEALLETMMQGEREPFELIPFSAHRIELPSGAWTMTDEGEDPLTAISTQALLEAAGHNLAGKKILDLGCLEGGYSAAFAALGAAEVIGVEAREENIRRCLFVKDKLALENVRFFKGDVKDIAVDQFGDIDIVFASGILYHLDDPYTFAKNCAAIAKDFAVFDTHVAFADSTAHLCSEETKRLVKGGRTYRGKLAAEYPADEDPSEIEGHLWAAYSNPFSFWLYEESLVQMLLDVGFAKVTKYPVPFGYRCGESCGRNCRIILLAFKSER